MKKIGLVSLGCAKNLVDSENILGLLDHEHYQITSSVQDADIIIVNTCGFIESSKKESIETIFEMLSYGKKVVVTGCLIERYYRELKKDLPEVSLFIPISSYSHFNDLLATIDDDLTSRGGLNDEYRLLSTGPVTAYLKIGEGCDNRCSYCAIPLIRGGFVSRPYEAIIKEANQLAKQGIKEIIVLEQDTTKYGIDLPNGENIVSLLKGLLAVEGLSYIRLLYLYPDEISDDLIELIATEKRLTPYFDIPIQHSEDRLLHAMNRRGSKEDLIELFNKIRKRVPHAILRTTVMVGFPGETKEEFEALKDFIQAMKFDHLGAFTYSREEGTSSYHLPHQISEKVKKQRLDEVMRLQQGISYRKNKQHIDEIMEGLIVGKEKNYYLFRSYWNAPDDVDGKIFAKSEKDYELGAKVQVRITEAFIYDLMGDILD